MSQVAESTEQVPSLAAVRAVRGIRRVASDTMWVVRDCARRHSVRMVTALILGIFGQLTMIGAVAGAFAYVQAVQSGESVQLSRLAMGPFRLPGSLSIDPSSSRTALVGVIVVLFAVVVLSALLQWWSKAIGANVVRRYEDDCTRSALRQMHETLARTPARHIRVAGRSLTRALLKLVTRDSRYCGRVANEAILSATPALTALVTVAFLIHISWVPLVALVAIILLIAPLYVRVNRRGMQSMLRLQVLSRRDALVKSDIVRDALASPERPKYANGEVLDNSQTQRYLDAYETRLKMAHASLFVGNILFAASLCAVLLFFGLFHGGGIGARVVIYLVAIQYLMYALRNLGKHVTNISVYHPSFGRFVQFMRTGSLDAIEEREETGTSTAEDALLEETLQE